MHKPNVEAGYYGADVAGPVFKRIAQKIYTDSPPTNHITDLDQKLSKLDKNYVNYYKSTKIAKMLCQILKGMQVMDAIALLENLGLKVKVNGWVK
ncbi:MAG: hypothetical protein R2808_04345 [Flavobacterium sp.]